MKTCATCDYFKVYKGYEKEGGECTNERIASGSQHNPDNMLVTYGGNDGYGDYMNNSPDFGCILHENTRDKVT